MRSYVLTLSSTPERLGRFPDSLPTPRVFWGTNWLGRHVPTSWQSSPGAYGCYLSHMALLAQAISDGDDPFLVFEDDAMVADASALSAFLEAAPADWEQLMPGGQLLPYSTEEIISPVLRRVSRCERTHCYALTVGAARSLLTHWQSEAVTDCDYTMGEWQQGHNVYAPIPFLVGQREGVSLIQNRRMPVNFHNPTRRTRVDIPVYWLPWDEKEKDAVLELARGGSIYVAYENVPAPALGWAVRDGSERGMRAVVDTLVKLASAFERAALVLWHPLLTEQNSPAPRTSLKELYDLQSIS